MRIPDLYASQDLTLSFEFFPPKSPEAVETLFTDTVPALQRLGPSFISVTYGAGGSTRGTTLGVVSRLKRDHGVEAMAHLTCVGSTKDMLASVLDEAQAKGIQNILALRGDPPKGQEHFQATAGGFAYALDLIKFVKAHGGFAVGGACYPEGHIECKDRKVDWDRAAAKVEAGAEFLITQLFYDARDFLDMEDYLRNQRGVKVPIIPGILPFLNTEQIKRFTALCGAKIPADLKQKLEDHAGNDETVRQLGVEVTTDICRKLMDHGVKGFHFYCLNRVASCREILRNLGLAPANGCAA